jgi:hypothetical protein
VPSIHVEEALYTCVEPALVDADGVASREGVR